MLGGKGGGEGRSFEDENASMGGAGKKRVASGPAESFSQDLDDEIPF